MKIFQPNVYKKNIFEIDYKKIKKEGIRCLVFDLDNTLGLISHKECPRETIKLLRKLKKNFIMVICSNNSRKRLKPYLDELNIEGVSRSMKPTTLGLFIIKRKYRLRKEEMCIIGDQMLTDVLAGNRFHIKTILVDPLGDTDLKITNFNRKIENLVMQRYAKKGLFKRGNYYE